MKVSRVVISADGVSLGNPGTASIGAIIKVEQGRVVGRISRRIVQQPITRRSIALSLPPWKKPSGWVPSRLI